MRRFVVVATLALMAAAAAPTPHDARAQGLGAADVTAAVRVLDGDTLEIAGTTVRLFGIDAPERNQTCTVRDLPWPCGALARDALADLAAGRVVECTPVARDALGRIMARCQAAGRDLAATMVKGGWALAARPESLDYVALEEAAAKSRAGLWRGDFVQPWVFRRIVDTAAR